MDVDYDRTELRIGDPTVTLDHRIVQTVETHGKVLVVVYPEDDEEAARRNVLAFDREGNRLWESAVPEKAEDHHFANVYEDDGTVLGWSWNGYEYAIDPETGAVDERRYKPK